MDHLSFEEVRILRDLLTTLNQAGIAVTLGRSPLLPARLLDS
jgi:hypothetical protein